jgi:hypothetical protein
MTGLACFGTSCAAVRRKELACNGQAFQVDGSSRSITLFVRPGSCATRITKATASGPPRNGPSSISSLFLKLHRISRRSRRASLNDVTTAAARLEEATDRMAEFGPSDSSEIRNSGFTALGYKANLITAAVGMQPAVRPRRVQAPPTRQNGHLYRLRENS